MTLKVGNIVKLEDKVYLGEQGGESLWIDRKRIGVIIKMVEYTSLGLMCHVNWHDGTSGSYSPEVLTLSGKEPVNPNSAFKNRGAR